jgi:hypothetical protein
MNVKRSVLWTYFHSLWVECLLICWSCSILRDWRFLWQGMLKLCLSFVCHLITSVAKIRWHRWWLSEWVRSVDGMKLTGEGEVWSAGNKTLSYWHFVHHRSHVGLPSDWTRTSVVRGWWLNCVSCRTVFLEVMLRALLCRSHHYRWRNHEDGDVCTRPYGVTFQEAVILTSLQWPQ